MYSIFDLFLIRTPRCPFNSLKEESLEAKLINPQVQEAIYIASPVLYSELQKYLSGRITSIKEKHRIESALYRYISRMSSRCTPFGLFAGCSIGLIASDNTKVILGDINRHTRLDMYFLCTLSQELSKLPYIKDNIRYYPNTTLYQIGKKYRYVEYRYTKYQRFHHISSIDRSVYVDTILKIARNGITIHELITYLFNHEIEPDTARKYIEELIDAQILVGELSPSVTGDDFFARIIRILDELNINKVLVSSLKEIQEMFYLLDSNPKDNIGLYQNIIQKIEELKIPYEEKLLFQVDMTRSVAEAMLGTDIVNELQSTMVFLNKITFSQKNKALDQFQQAFYNRYEDREIPLMEALDPEIGIGYPVNKSTGDISPLLENLFIPGRINQEADFQSNTFMSLLFKKTIKALKHNENEIVFNDDEVEKFNTNWQDLPPTIYSMFEILKSGSDNPLINLSGSGFYGTCGANLFARFAHTNEDMSQLVHEIAAKEQEQMPDILLAEIVHLPESRVGNVLSRPHIRDYEIMYLASSDLPQDRLIFMSDLLISIHDGRIVLRSKRLNKEIVPRLTNAHNYRKNSMPVYHFLCDIQMQQGRTGLFFNWGHVENGLSFLPRIRYKNTILCLATWKINLAEMRHLFELEDNNELNAETKKFREKYSLPPKMLLPDGDNELFVDWENIRSLKALFSIIKTREMISLKEFLYDSENSVVIDMDGNPYPNECIVAFHKNEKK